MFTSFLFPLLLSLDSITHNDDHSLHTPLISLLPFPSIMLEWQNHRLSYTNPICFIGIILCWVGCALNLRQQTLSNSPVLHNLSTFLQPIVCSILQEDTFMHFLNCHQHRVSDSTSSFIEQKDSKKRETKQKQDKTKPKTQ